MCIRLAQAYNVNKKYVEVHPIEARNIVQSPRMVAEPFEAYFGLLLREVIHGTISIATLMGYFSRLLTPEVFPDLNSRIQAAHDAYLVQEQGPSGKKNIKRARIELERPKHADVETMSAIADGSQGPRKSLRLLERALPANQADNDGDRTSSVTDTSAMVSVAIYCYRHVRLCG